ncbi:MAG: MATE family efflux transporter [Acidimicrobiia bacterium]|nr:MATE family efflux transporter [Acidimicrobiia bacterium]
MFRRTPHDRQIIGLAIPALGALAAEPLYILADTAVVGHLGTPQLAGLALASQVLLILVSIFIFLAYGTTATVGRLLGAGREREAAHQAVQSLWLALIVGVVLSTATLIAADPLLRLLGGRGEVLDAASTYLRVSAFGLPALLISLAGVGYLRGQQDTLRPLYVSLATAAGNLILELILIYGFDQGIGASALSTVVMQWLGAVAYLLWIGAGVRRYHVGLVPRGAAIGSLAVSGFHLLIRTTSLRASFVVAVAVAARIGDDDLAAHQIAFEIWSLLALSLDAIAIAGQAIVANLLGAGDGDGARAAGRRMIEIGVLTGCAAALLVVVSQPWLPGVFSPDPAVVSLAAFLFWWLAIMQPVNGLVFTLDGLLIGAGDLRYLAVAMAGASAVFVPLALGVAVADLGIGWLWAALVVFMMMRVVPLTHRFRSGRWIVLGAQDAQLVLEADCGDSQPPLELGAPD